MRAEARHLCGAGRPWVPAVRRRGELWPPADLRQWRAPAGSVRVRLHRRSLWRGARRSLHRLHPRGAEVRQYRRPDPADGRRQRPGQGRAGCGTGRVSKARRHRMSKTEKEKMLAGELYRPDAELGAEQAATKGWLVRYNAALALPVSQRHALLRERLAHVGNDAVIRPPFFCDYGYNIRLGDNVFLN